MLASCGTRSKEKPPKPNPDFQILEGGPFGSSTYLSMFNTFNGSEGILKNGIENPDWEVKADFNIPYTSQPSDNEDAVGIWIGLQTNDWLVQIIATKVGTRNWAFLTEATKDKPITEPIVLKENAVSEGDEVSAKIIYNHANQRYTLSMGGFSREIILPQGEKTPLTAQFAVEVPPPYFLTKFSDIMFENLMVNGEYVNQRDGLAHTKLVTPSGIPRTHDTFDVNANTINVHWLHE